MPKHEYFMAHAKVTASASKCTYFQVGAVIVKEGRIISHGYNGTPSGYPEDCPGRFSGKPEEREEHHKFSEQTTIHAEMNAILWAARSGIPIDGAVLYATLQPCHNCIKACVGAGIKAIIYETPYDRADAYSAEFCKKSGVLLACIGDLPR